MPSRRFADILTLLVLTALWGSAFAVIKVTVEEIPPMTIATGRIVVASVLLIGFLPLMGVQISALFKADRRMWGQFMVLGLLGNGIPFTLVGFGQERIDSSLAAILIGTMPIFTVLLARGFKVERHLSARHFLGVAVGFAGLIVLMGPAALAGLGDIDNLSVLVGQLAIVGGAFSYAANAVYGRVLTEGMPISLLAAGNMLACAVIMVPATLIMERPWTLDPSWGSIGWVVWLGVGSTAFGVWIYLRLLLSAGPTFASLINYMIPGLGIVIGTLWLGELVGPRELAALALILVAMALIRTRAGKPPGGEKIASTKITD
jgi:drug/metabolite transporter (DMT)-like permease